MCFIFYNGLISIFLNFHMDNSTTHHSSETDHRLSEFVLNYAESGDSMIHTAAKLGFSTGQCLAVLQQLFDQYIHSSMYDSFNEDQRKEFEYLVEKYKLVRSEAYTRTLSFD